MFYQKTLRNVPLISDPFIKAHLFETIVFLQKEIGFHYTEVSYTGKTLANNEYIKLPQSWVLCRDGFYANAYWYIFH